MQVSPMSNTNFQASLDLRAVKSNKARWNNVAKIFSEETQKIPHGKIIVKDLNTNMRLSACSDIRQGWDDTIEALFFKKTMNEMFEKYSDNTIAKTLAKFLKIGVSAEKECAKASKFADKMAKKAILEEDKELVFDRIYGDCYGLIKEEVQNKASQDKIMKQWEIL